MSAINGDPCCSRPALPGGPATTPNVPTCGYSVEAMEPRGRIAGVTPQECQPAGPGRTPQPATGDGHAGLAELAGAYGVATSYVGANERPVTVSPAVVRTVLGLLGVDTSDPAAALARHRDAPWCRLVPPATVVRRQDPDPVVIHVVPGAVAAELELETGGKVELTDIGPPDERRAVGGRDLVAVPVALPPGLPLGDHRLRVRVGAETGTGLVTVVPDRLPAPAAPAAPAAAAAAATSAAPEGTGGASAPGGRMWGWMIQLYAMPSAASWGIGDYADLATLAAWSASRAGGNADMLLVNPLHAGTPTFPVETSPYCPGSRRYISPLYLRPEDTPEYAEAPAAVRDTVDAYASAARAAHGWTGGAGGTAPEGAQLLDRDAVWRAKLAALELLYDTARRAGRLAGNDSGTETGDDDDADGLTDFATWCALAERYGRDWRAWPEPLRDPRSPATAAARVEYAGRVAFHRWLQRRSDAQLTAAQDSARRAGMSVGIVHDLAVGVDPGGADAWALADILAGGASIGAPPDGFSQQGQNWGLPPWRPDRLADTGYAPFRRMVAAMLRRGGGLRVDHILGLFRLWWVPSGNTAAEGTYVRYDADAMLGVLALEATRAGALVIGEDLGTVEASVAASLKRVGVLGSSVLWFEKDATGAPKPPSAWREQVVASVSTHDLPTAAGFLDGEHVRVRARLGLLRRPEADEHASWQAELDALLGLLRRLGLLGPAAAGGAAGRGDAALPAGVGYGDAGRGDAALPAEDVVLAMHGLLLASPARVVLASPADAFGDRRQPNLPGTVDAYPNWRLPVTDGAGRPVTVERFVTDPAVRRLAGVLAGVRTDRPS